MKILEIGLVILFILLANIFDILPISEAWYICLTCLIFLIIRKSSWDEIGLSIKNISWRKTILTGIVAGIVLQIIGELILTPAIYGLTGQKPNLEDFKPIIGDRGILLYYLSLIWTQVALSEEIAFRGYFTGLLVSFFNDNRKTYTIVTIIISIFFGLAHQYKGWPGIIDSTFSGLYFGLLYVFFNKNLWVSIIAHAVSDTIACLLIYYQIIAL